MYILLIAVYTVFMTTNPTLLAANVAYRATETVTDYNTGRRSTIEFRSAAAHNAFRADCGFIEGIGWVK